MGRGGGEEGGGTAGAVLSGQETIRMKLSRERLAASVGKQTIVIFVFVMYLTGGNWGQVGEA